MCCNKMEVVSTLLLYTYVSSFDFVIKLDRIDPQQSWHNHTRTYAQPRNHPGTYTRGLYTRHCINQATTARNYANGIYMDARQQHRHTNMNHHRIYCMWWLFLQKSVCLHHRVSSLIIPLLDVVCCGLMLGLARIFEIPSPSNVVPIECNRATEVILPTKQCFLLNILD